MCGKILNSMVNRSMFGPICTRFKTYRRSVKLPNFRTCTVCTDMSDEWPYDTYLPLIGYELIWKFDYIRPDVQILHVFLADGSRQRAEVNLRYVPVLVCFDLEYWMAMNQNDTAPHPGEVLKRRMLKTYMHNLRCATVRDILAADKDELRDGTWHMEILHQWSIRTWNDYTHSDFGRARYEKSCNTKRLKPYDQVITIKGMYSEIDAVTIAFTEEFTPDWRLYFAHFCKLNRYTAEKCDGTHSWFQHTGHSQLMSPWDTLISLGFLNGMEPTSPKYQSTHNDSIRLFLGKTREKIPLINQREIATSIIESNIHTYV